MQMCLFSAFLMLLKQKTDEFDAGYSRLKQNEGFSFAFWGFGPV